MSRCDLSIVLEKPDAPVVAGTQLRGFVGVVVSQDVNTRGLHIQLVCRTHGRGTKWSEVAHALVAYEGRWRAGEQQLYPFDFTVPDGPVSYDGELLNVSWFVYTYADIPWAFDPTSEMEVEVIAGSGGFRQGPLVHQRSAVLPRAVPMVIALIGTPIILVFGTAPWLFPLVDSSTSLPELLFSVLWSTVSYTVAGLFLFAAVRTPLARRRLGTFEIEVSPTEFHPGDALHVTIHHEHRPNLRVRSLTVFLRAQEVVISGSGTNKTTHTHTVFEQSQRLLHNEGLSSRRKLQTRLQLPSDAPPSFGVRNNRLSWVVEVHVDLPLWPDLQEQIGVVVRPGARPALPPPSEHSSF